MTLLLCLLACQSSFDAAVEKLNEKGVMADTAPGLVEIGDEFTKLLRKYPKQRPAILQHASDWYEKAWPDLDDVWKSKLRVQLGKIHFPLRPGRAVKGRPAGWGGITAEGCFVDVANTKAKSGGAALKFGTQKEGVHCFLQVPKVAVRPGQKLELSVWLLTEGTSGAGDSVVFVVGDATGGLVQQFPLGLRPDHPFWVEHRVEIVAPDKAFSVGLDLRCASPQGAIWVDDISIKADGKSLQFEGFER